MTPFILIDDPNPTLQITPARYHEWKEHAEAGGVLIWNREGAVRTVQPDVILNTLRVYEAYRVEDGLGGVTPIQTTVIYWEQASSLEDRNDRANQPRQADDRR